MKKKYSIRGMNSATLLLAGLLVLLSCKNNEETTEPEKSDTVIELDLSQVVSTDFKGNGVQWSAYPDFSDLVTEEKWQTLYKRLDFMKPSLIRVMISAGWRYQDGDYNRKLEPLLKLLSYCQDNEIEVTFGEWGSYDADILDDDYTDDEAWLDLAAGYLEFLVKQHGMTCIKSYILINEPNGDWSSTKGNFGVWERLVKSFQQRLEAMDLHNDIKIAGPDAAFFNDDNGTKSWVTNSLNNLDDIIGMYNIHAYIGSHYVRSKDYSEFFRGVRDITMSASKPFIMGELGFKYYDDPELDTENKARAEADGYTSVDDCNMFVYDFSYGIDMADVCIQSMNVGFDGMVAWDLDDAMHQNGYVDGRPQLKRWGFWNILGGESKFGSRPEDEEIRPWFYTWSLLCRYFPPGTEIIKSIEIDKRGLSYVVGRKDNEYSIAVVNNFYKEYDFQLKFDSTVSLSFDKFVYNSDKRPVDDNNFAIPSDRLENKDMGEGLFIKIPSQTFFLYSSMQIE